MDWELHLEPTRRTLLGHDERQPRWFAAAPETQPTLDIAGRLFPELQYASIRCVVRLYFLQRIDPSECYPAL